jgi:hypothetical protein
MKDVPQRQILGNQHVVVESAGDSMDTDTLYKRPFRSERRQKLGQTGN